MMKNFVVRGVSTLLILLCSSIYFSCCSVVVLQESLRDNSVAVNVGFIYDEGNSIGKMGLNCIRMALSDFYESHPNYKTRIVLHTRPYAKDSVVGAAAAALHLLKYSQVKAIIGPTTSTEAEFVIHLGNNAQVPIISYSATSSWLSSFQSPYFIRIAQDDSQQAKPISALVQAFLWREVVPIYADDDYGAGFLPYLADALQNIDANIPYSWAMPLYATDDQIRKELHKLKMMQTRVFLVHMSPEPASRLFSIINELEMMDDGYAWILTTGICNDLGSLNDHAIDSMQGAVGVKTYIPETKEMRSFYSRWNREYHDVELNVMGLWAYDAASAVARAVEEVRVPDSSFHQRNVSAKSTDLDTLGISPVGPELLEKFLNTRFIGLSGDFELTNRQLESFAYQIVNVIGTSDREIAFWTPEKGMVKHLSSRKKTTISSSNAMLLAIHWPGDTVLPPKGWEIPTGGQKLKVGVPVKAVYEELVNITHDEKAGTTVATGFCVDVFNAVMEKLQYTGRYDFIPFADSDGNGAGSYDDLVLQVFYGNYDIVVGDISIVANRSSYVDFTLPYTESGVTMVVPVKNEKTSAWVFLKPLTKNLWVATFSAFIFIAFVIWVLEHRINEEFRGPPLHQAGTSLFYSFSVMVFAQRENVYSNLARFVMIVWLFVVLVLTQSYTASLTSMLTVQQLQPTVTEVDDLIRQGASVGFQDGSFVKELLIGKGFHETKLVSYSTSDQLDDLLSKGNSNGGIAAVFDEIPYMRIFLAKYSSKYIMVQPIYKTAGFGFAFPRGSPLTPEVSREMLKVTEGDAMLKIEQKWGLQLFNGSDQGNTITSGSIGLGSFWGLFLITGVAAALALLFFTATFLFEHRHIWMNSDASTWIKIRSLVRVFEQRDIASHTFRRNEVPLSTRNTKDEQANKDGEGGLAIVQDQDYGTPPRDYGTPPRSSEHSDETEDNLTFSATATTPDDA